MKRKLSIMKEVLLKYIEEAIALLEACMNVGTYEEWFRNKAKDIKEKEIDSREFIRAIKELSDRLAGGMGAFDDVILRPKDTSSLSKEEATKRQFELIENIDNTIDKILKELRAEKRKSKKRK